MLIVVTADQRSSRRGSDLVPEVLASLNEARRDSPHRAFERTAGDEIQGVLSGPGDVLDVVEHLLRDRRWSIGIGIGAVELPLPRSTRAGRGEAFVAARAAVESAKHSPTRIRVEGSEDVRAAALETVLMLWGDLFDRRTRGGWEVADLLARGLSREEVAGRLGITVSAVGQRIAAAGLVLSERARSLAAEMLSALLEEEPR